MPVDSSDPTLGTTFEPVGLIPAGIDRFTFNTCGAAFQVSETSTVSEITEAGDAPGSSAAEQHLRRLRHEFAPEMTKRVLPQRCDDPSPGRAAPARTRQIAATKSIELRGERKTEVRTPGGQVTEVATPYARARPRSGGAVGRREAQGTGSDGRSHGTIPPVLAPVAVEGARGRAARSRPVPSAT